MEQSAMQMLINEINNDYEPGENHLADRIKSLATSLLAKEAEDKKNDAIAFAEWIKDNAYHNVGSWYLHEAMSGEIYSTKQLYTTYSEDIK